jgi:hypothetical protein
MLMQHCAFENRRTGKDGMTRKSWRYVFTETCPKLDMLKQEILTVDKIYSPYSCFTNIFCRSYDVKGLVI